jgi:mRNA interferase RelE/StbE
MKILFEKKFLKDIEGITNKAIKRQIESVIAGIEKSTELNSLRNLKKLKGHPFAYRIRVGNYRIGFFYLNQTIILTRVLDRKDIYKYFP